MIFENLGGAGEGGYPLNPLWIRHCVCVLHQRKQRLTFLSFFQDPNGIPWIDDSRVSGGLVDAREALAKFQQWSEANRQQLSNYDAIMMFTRFEHILYYIINGPPPEKTCLRRFANNKGADRPLDLRSLISAFVIHLLKRVIFRLATSEIPILQLV